jgi:hypothetical protein
VSKTSLAVAVLSCDAYSDLWTPFFHCFTKQWSDCPFPVYLESNQIDRTFAGVKTIPVGRGGTWSQDLRRFLEQIPETHVLIFLEDVFLTAPVVTHKVSRYFDDATALNASYFRLRPVPMPDSRVQAGIGRLSPDALWRTAAAFAIWNKSRLLDILDDRENAWEFDTGSFVRTRADPNFYCTYRFVFSFCHGVQKGKWFPWSYLRMKWKGVPLEKNRRRIMNFREGLRSFVDLMITNIFQMVPGKKQPKLILMLKRFRNIFRFRVTG